MECKTIYKSYPKMLVCYTCKLLFFFGSFFAISSFFRLIKLVLNGFPCFTKLNILKECHKPGELLESEYFILIHTEMLRNPRIASAKLVEFFDDVTHQIDIVRATCAVVTNGGCHPIVKALIDDRYGKLAPFSFINIGIVKHHAIAVETVNDHIDVFLLDIVAHNRHRVSRKITREFFITV